MVDRVDGVNQMQHSQAVQSVQKENRQITQKKSEDQNKLKDNQLSSEQLKQKLQEKIEDMNQIVGTLEEKLSFKLHDDTDRLMTQVIDVKSQEVIKEMPPKEMLDLAARIHKMVGIIIDEEV